MTLEEDKHFAEKTKLYWVCTEDHHEDWFIVASTAKKAARLHENLEGYNPGDAWAEEILTIPTDVFVEETGWPSCELLQTLGANFISAEEPRVVEIGGKTFCEGLLAATINETTDDLFERMGQGRLNNTRRRPDVPADFLQAGSDTGSFLPPAGAESEENRLDNNTCSTCGAVRVFDADGAPGKKRLSQRLSPPFCPECGCRIDQEVKFSTPEQHHFVDDLPINVPDDLFNDGDNLADIFGSEAMGECQGCDIYDILDDLGLCNSCSDKLARDLIRQRDWAYSGLAYGVAEVQREELRKKVIAQYGKKLELIAPSGKSKSSGKRKKRKKSRKK